MELVNFFALIDKTRLLRLLGKGEFDDIDFISPEDSDIEMDQRNLPHQRFFNEIGVKEVLHADYRRFRDLEALRKGIIVFPRHQLYGCKIVNNVLHSSVRVSPMKKRETVNIHSKKKNFLMVELNIFPPEGSIAFVLSWESLLRGNYAFFFREKVNSGQKILIERLCPTSKLTARNKIFNPKYLVRYLLPYDWQKIKNEDLGLCQARLFRPEEVDNNHWLKANCIPASLRLINDRKPKVLTA